MNCHVGGMKCKYALDRLVVPKIWVVQVETNLTQDEIKFLEEVGFVLNKQQSMLSRSLFRGESSIPINRPLDEMLWPTSRNGKVVCCMVAFKMSNLHYNQWEVSRLLEVTINPPLEASFP
jgi:hypothetical protein